ncbi:TatD family deoxyribonuclease [Enterocloster aldenensis]|uniref:TatD family hydrolase n=1 Tax=Enterocloster aldenensis TaxID=358742 RepID=UPI000E553AA7|nr:TatD family deoxyribonuclease [Enterocloster aldenensis]
MDIKYYDIGLNLFSKQFKNPEDIIINARAKQVVCILTGTSTKANRQVSDFVSKHELVYGTAGIHPHNADTAKIEDFKLIENIITSNLRIVAVGECGLDYDRMYSTRDNQIRCLEKHINLAEKLDKPLFLHERSASDDFKKRFKNHKDLCEKSVVHCFTGNKYVLDDYLNMGFSIGITGWICDDKRGKELREAVKLIPLDRILIETDAPYLTPKNVDGLSKVNVPENIIYVARELAKHMNVSEEELIVHAKENTERVFLL